MRLGDLDDLQKTFELWLFVGKDYNEGERNMIKAAINEVKAMPTVDAVPVVRCDVCKHKNNCQFCYGSYGDNPDHYCAEGERVTNSEIEIYVDWTRSRK